MNDEYKTEPTYYSDQVDKEDQNYFEHDRYEAIREVFKGRSYE